MGEEKESDRPVMTSTSKAAPAQPKDQCDILQHSGGDPLTSLQELHLSLTQGTSPKVTEDFDLLKNLQYCLNSFHLELPPANCSFEYSVIIPSSNSRSLTMMLKLLKGVALLLVHLNNMLRSPTHVN